MDQRSAEFLGGIMSGTVMSLDTLIRHLEAKGLLSRSDIAHLLEARVKGASSQSPFPPEMARLDFLLMTSLAEALRDAEPPGWDPVVIKGGKPPKQDN